MRRRTNVWVEEWFYPSNAGNLLCVESKCWKFLDFPYKLTNGRTNQAIYVRIRIRIHMSSTLWLQCITLTWLGYWFTTRAECCINILQVKSNVEIRWLQKPPSQSESRQNLCISMWTCVHHICTSSFIPPCWCYCRCWFYRYTWHSLHCSSRSVHRQREHEMDLMYICIWVFRGVRVCVCGVNGQVIYIVVYGMVAHAR